jgi:ketosteroid isomerase-like protein
VAASELLAAAERLYAALESEDVADVLELCSLDVEVHYPTPGQLSYGGHWQGRDGVASFLDAHDAAEEILEFAVSRMIADGDTVIAMGNFAGRARPSGREWSTRFVHQLTFSGELLRRWEAFFDTAAALAARAPADPGPRD